MIEIKFKEFYLRTYPKEIEREKLLDKAYRDVFEKK